MSGAGGERFGPSRVKWRGAGSEKPRPGAGPGGGEAPGPRRRGRAQALCPAPPRTARLCGRPLGKPPGGRRAASPPHGAARGSLCGAAQAAPLGAPRLKIRARPRLPAVGGAAREPGRAAAPGSHLAELSRSLVKRFVVRALCCIFIRGRSRERRALFPRNPALEKLPGGPEADSALLPKVTSI